MSFFFFFNDTATTEIYTLSLHDALPILLVAFMASGRWPISLSVSPDLRVFGFAATVSMLSGILFGLSPALRSTQVDLTPALKESPGDMSPGARGKSGIRLGLAEGLIVTQGSL